MFILYKHLTWMGTRIVSKAAGHIRGSALHIIRILSRPHLNWEMLIAFIIIINMTVSKVALGTSKLYMNFQTLMSTLLKYLFCLWSSILALLLSWFVIILHYRREIHTIPIFRLIPLKGSNYLDTPCLLQHPYFVITIFPWRLLTFNQANSLYISFVFFRLSVYLAILDHGN